MASLNRAANRLSDSADRSTELAADRNVFAAERTYAAWVRTGLAAMASSVGAKTLLPDIAPGWEVMALGSVLALFSAFCFFAAVWRQNSPGPPPPRPDARRIPSLFLYVINGFLALVALGVLFIIWFGPNRGLH